MNELKSLAADLGWKNIESYIQSGNLIFSAKDPIASSLETAIEAQFQFRPFVLILDAEAFTKILEACPFIKEDDRNVHISFCTQEPEADIPKIETLKSATENWSLVGRAFYLFAPDGIARSKLAANIEKLMGVSCTARNLRTARAISERL